MKPDDRALKEALLAKINRHQTQLNALPYPGHPNAQILEKHIRDAQEEIKSIAG